MLKLTGFPSVYKRYKVIDQLVISWILMSKETVREDRTSETETPPMEIGLPAASPQASVTLNYLFHFRIKL